MGIQIGWLEEQLVGPSDINYKGVHFRESPSTVCQTAIKVAKLLSSHEMEEMNLGTTPCLSLFGIYMERSTGLLIVHCKKKESFTIRFNDYELLDVMTRTGRNDLWADGGAVEGKTYMEPNEKHEKLFVELELLYKGDDTEEIPVSIVRSDIELLGATCGLKVPVEVKTVELGLIPLLPVYLSYREQRKPGEEEWDQLIHSVEFWQERKEYEDSLKVHVNDMVLVQNLYYNLQRFRHLVQLDRVPTIEVCIRSLLAQVTTCYAKRLHPRAWTPMIIAWYQNAAVEGPDSVFVVDPELDVFYRAMVDSAESFVFRTPQ